MRSALAVATIPLFCVYIVSKRTANRESQPNHTDNGTTKEFFFPSITETDSKD
jgi:hypothetical protein